jgi:hypothetical protein
MLKLIYQLYNVKPKHANPPSDQELAVFIGKAAGIKIRETEPNAEGKQYNWVAEIHETKGFQCETGIKLEVTHTNLQPKQEALFDSALSRNSAYVDPGLEGIADDVPF